MDTIHQPETKVLSVSDGVWALDQQMVRSFLIVGEKRALLLDTGAIPCPMDEMIREITDLPLIVVHSHTDGDHTANDRLFPQICMHAAEEQHMREKPDGVEYFPICEGMFFDLGGRKLRVIEIPGHTPGSIALLDEDFRILFSGDTVSYGPVFLFGQGRDIQAYRQSLKKLKDLDGYDTVYPCHNTCPVDRGVIDELLSAVDGALDGSIAPTKADMPMPPDAGEVSVYSYGRSGILYNP